MSLNKIRTLGVHTLSVLIVSYLTCIVGDSPYFPKIKSFAANHFGLVTVGIGDEEIARRIAGKTF